MDHDANLKLETRNQEPKEGRQVWLTRYLPLLVWIGVIFFFSSTQGSMSHTSRIIRPLLEWLFPLASEETLLFYHGVVRKAAHFTEYAVLGLLACRAFISSASLRFSRRPFIAAVVLVCVVAVIDETQQSFNPTRTGSPYDVLIDVVGGITAIGIAYVFVRMRGQNRIN